MIGITGRSNRSSVSQKRLGDLAVFENGDPYRPVDWSESGLPIVRIENLNNPCAPYHYYQGPTADKVQIGNGELLLAWSASLGVYQWNRGLALLNQHIFRVTPLSNDVTSDYLYHILSWALSGLAALTHGGTMHHIQKPALESYLVPCPPLAEQRRIAAKLDEQMASLASAQAALAAQREATTVLRSAVLRTALDPATHPDWPVLPLGHLGTLQSGGTPSKAESTFWDNGHVPFVTGADITSGTVSAINARSFLTTAGIQSGKTAVAAQNDVVIVTRTRVGRVGVAAEALGVSQDVTLLRCTSRVSPEYIMWCLLANSERLIAASRGATIQGLTREVVSQLLIPVPPLTKQRSVVSFLQRTRTDVDKTIAAIDVQAATLDSLRASLLDAAFSGQV